MNSNETNSTISKDSKESNSSEIEKEKKKLTLVNFIKIATVCHPIVFKPMQGKYDLLVKCETFVEIYGLMNKIFREYFSDSSIPYEERLEVYTKVKTTPLSDEIKEIYKMVDEEERTLLRKYYEDKKFIKDMANAMKNIETNDFETQFQLLVQRQEMIKQLPKIDVVQLTEPLYFSANETLQKRKEIIIETMEKATQNQLEQIVAFMKQKESEKKSEKRNEDDLPFIEAFVNLNKLNMNDLKELERILNINSD